LSPIRTEPRATKEPWVIRCVPITTSPSSGMISVAVSGSIKPSGKAR
jgi:hypothetical protein